MLVFLFPLIRVTITVTMLLCYSQQQHSSCSFSQEFFYLSFIPNLHKVLFNMQIFSHHRSHHHQAASSLESCIIFVLCLPSNRNGSRRRKALIRNQRTNRKKRSSQSPLRVMLHIFTSLLVSLSHSHTITTGIFNEGESNNNCWVGNFCIFLVNFLIPWNRNHGPGKMVLPFSSISSIGHATLSEYYSYWLQLFTSFPLPTHCLWYKRKEITTISRFLLFIYIRFPLDCP